MTPSDRKETPEPQREESLFQAAAHLTGAERAAFLNGACHDNPALRQRIEALLAAHEARDSFLEPENGRPDNKPLKTIKLEMPEEQADEAVGQTLGRYKLLERVGEGGCGVVYVAEQTEPVRRRVALKVIKLGMDTKQVVARFEAERQALAMMDHPNIAKVLDAGTTDVGRPFFVMELVRGIKITDYCDQANLSTKERLDLFIKVCQAIQHAHQKGIIHRDIKPSNILVTLHDGVPVPKVIDFGIAKATEGRLTDNTVYTQLHQFIGTPAYMSPEQAEMSGLDIDTRSDIYSLGVLLYELLAGSTPFDPKELMASGIDVMRKTIREKEPVRPSTKLQTFVAADVRRLNSPESDTPRSEEEVRASSRRLLRIKETITLLRGDLDWIVMKCLEKDRTRRYDTATGLAADLKRHLNNEPVVARPPSAAYKLQKAWRRNKGVFAAGAAVMLALVVGIIVSARQAVRATHAEAQALVEKAQAQVEKANAEGALHFIQDDVLSQASPGYQADRDLKVRVMLDRVAERLDRATGRPPLVEASIRQTLGSVYTELGDYAKATQNYEGALKLQRQLLGENHSDTLRSLYGLAMAHWWGGGMARAEPLTRQGLEACRRVLGETNSLTLQFMQAHASALMSSGETPWPELDSLFQKALKLHRQVLGPDDPRTLRLIYMMSIGSNLNWVDAKMPPLLEDAVERSIRVLGEQHPQTAGLITGLAVSYVNLNELDKAETMALRCMELRRNILGEEHPLTIASTLILARVYVVQGKFEKADALTDRALILSRRFPVENNQFLVWHLSSLGWAYLEQGRLARADTLCDPALQAMRRKPDSNPAASPRVITQLGAVRLAEQNYTEAEVLLRESLRLAEKRWPDAGYRFYAMSLLGASLAGQKKYAEAEPLLVQGYHGLQQRQASMPPYLNATRRITESLESLAQLYDAWGKPTQATEWKKKLGESPQAAKAAAKREPQP